MSKFTLLTGKISKETRHSAAFDIFYAGDLPVLLVDKPFAFSTGITTEFDQNLVARVLEKSGLAVKVVELKAGVIDSDYRKEWFVIARNPVWWVIDEKDYRLTGKPEVFVDPNWKPIEITPGMKIAQLILQELPDVEMLGEGISVKDVERIGGLGSTGA